MLQKNEKKKENEGHSQVKMMTIKFVDINS